METRPVSFRSFVRAFARSGYLVDLDLKRSSVAVTFSLLARRTCLFPCVRAGRFHFSLWDRSEAELKPK